MNPHTGTIFEQATVDAAMAHLSAKDKRLARLFARFPAESRPPPENLFANMCRTVNAQMLSNHAARAIFGRFEALCGGTPEPAAVEALSDEALRGAGMSKSKIACLRALAAYIRSDGNVFGRLEQCPDEEVCTALLAIKGLGPWSVEMFQLFSLGRTDVYSARDAALANGLIKLKRLDPQTPRPRLEAIAKRWSPYRSIVSLSLWKWRHHDWEPV